MSGELIVRSAAGLLPVLAFLGGLVLIDSYKLVRARGIARALAAGGVAAAVCYVVNGALLDATGIALTPFARYLAPLVEEAAKAAYVLYLLRSNAAGFLVDAAIYGFAVGAGFALVENVYYLTALTDATPLTWIARGFGTAVMHGGTAALFGILAKAFHDRTRRAWSFLPALAVAYAVHALFNHFLLPPLVSTAVLVAVVPLLLLVVFQRSEAATRAWLGEGFDADEGLLRLLRTPGLVETRVGQYLHALREKFSGEVVTDMICLLRLRAELSIRAKGILLMRAEGFEPPPDPTLQARFAEIAYLEDHIGPTGLLALDPLLPRGDREVWQDTLLTDA